MLAAAIAGAFVAIGVTTALVLAGEPVWAGIASSAATVLLAAAVWRAPGHVVAAFLADLADRAFDAAVLSAFAWALRDMDPAASVAALLTLAGGFLGAYVVSRGRALGFATTARPWELVVRCGLVSAALVSGSVAVLWAAAVVASGLAVVRAFAIPARATA